MRVFLKGVYLQLCVDLMLYTFLIFMIVKDTRKLRKLRVELQTVQIRNEELTNQYDQIREVRHNFGNFIQALCGYVEVKNIKGIEEMCSRVQKETCNTHEVRDSNITRICNPALEKLIENKLSCAKQKNINIKMESKTNLRNLKIDTYDLCKIIGILLDNAIEAAEKSKEKEIVIKIFENKKARRKNIHIENSYEGIVDIAKLYTKGYTSKAYENGSHGLGLWSVKKFIQTNDEIHMVTRVNDKFCQQIEINF
jgi:two-component system sensor histidine kinase AgrC